MNSPDTFVNGLGLAYGALLMAAAFVSSPLTEALRIDALFIRDAGPGSRPLNLIAGLLVAGYAGYSLFLK